MNEFTVIGGEGLVVAPGGLRLSHFNLAFRWPLAFLR